MYCHYIHVGWCIGKCPLYRGVLYSECPLLEDPLFEHAMSITNLFGSLVTCYNVGF